MEFKRYFYTNYYVSDTGVVKSKFYGKERILTPQIINDIGIIKVYEKGKKKRVPVHRMVMICHNLNIGFPFLKVLHIDGNKQNNHLSNLKWGEQAKPRK